MESATCTEPRRDINGMRMSHAITEGSITVVHVLLKTLQRGQSCLPLKRGRTQCLYFSRKHARLRPLRARRGLCPPACTTAQPHDAADPPLAVRRTPLCSNAVGGNRPAVHDVTNKQTVSHRVKALAKAHKHRTSHLLVGKCFITMNV